MQRLSLAVLASFLCQSASFSVVGCRSGPTSRPAPISMKGRGTRGMPGKGVKPPPGSGFNKDSKKRMSKRDFQRSEWTLVAEKGGLGEEIGSTLAVEAGQSPVGQNYIWTLIRGEDGAGAMADDFSNVYATDGSCRACSFPMVKSSIQKEPTGEYSVTCGNCGSRFSLEDGNAFEWLPGNGPLQWMAKKLNENKEEMAAGVLKTRVAKSGRVYVRLPDGTLPIQKSAADRAAELAGTA